MAKISPATIPSIVESMASAIGQAMQLARTRLASAASPILRLMIQRDHEVTESELLRQELEILRAGRENMPSQKRPDYQPAQRLAILQIMRLRDWNLKTVAQRFVIHENTLRAWITSAAGNGNPSLLAGAIAWNRIDDAVRWAVREIQLWQRLTLLALCVVNIQRRLDSFAAWYNTARPHSPLGSRTPDGAYCGKALPKPVVYRTRDGPNIQIQTAREKYRGEARLPIVDIQIRKAA